MYETCWPHKKKIVEMTPFRIYTLSRKNWIDCAKKNVTSKAKQSGIALFPDFLPTVPLSTK